MPLPERKPASLDASRKQSFGKGVFRKCDGCGETLTAERLAQTWEVCEHCGRHHKLATKRWLELLLDEGSYEAWDANLVPGDPLGFEDGKRYPDRIKAAQKASGWKDAICTGRGRMEGAPVALGIFTFEFLGGSMGSVVGEKITRLFERAIEERLPVVLLSASGGARMQEGILSLMQMAKTVAAREKLRKARLPFLSVSLHPTTGGVAASFALLGDVNFAEPGALIGFAGQRVIEATIRQTLPDGFQRAEFLKDHGMIDRIVPRTEMKREFARIAGMLSTTP